MTGYGSTHLVRTVVYVLLHHIAGILVSSSRRLRFGLTPEATGLQSYAGLQTQSPNLLVISSADVICGMLI